MIARLPNFLRSSDAAAVILALLLVFAMAAARAPDRETFSLHPVVATGGDVAQAVIRA